MDELLLLLIKLLFPW